MIHSFLRRREIRKNNFVIAKDSSLIFPADSARSYFVFRGYVVWRYSIDCRFRVRNLAPSFNLSRNFAKRRLHPLYLIPDISICGNQRKYNLKYKSSLVIATTLPLLLYKVEHKSLLRDDRCILASTW
jgi:hypothetical protein